MIQCVDSMLSVTEKFTVIAGCWPPVPHRGRHILQNLTDFISQKQQVVSKGSGLSFMHCREALSVFPAV